MSLFFLDSSSLIKRYVMESGTLWVREIIAPAAGNVIFISEITPVEVVSGAMRRKRDGSITSRTARAVRLLVDRLDRHASREYRVVGLASPILERAEDLLERYALRAHDSIQLASAIESNARIIAAGLPAMPLVCADVRLLDVAADEGLPCINPALQVSVRLYAC